MEEAMGGLVDRVHRTLLVRFERLTRCIRALEERCAALENNLRLLRGEVPCPLRKSVASLAREADQLRAEMDAQRQASLEDDQRFHGELAEAEVGVEQLLELKMLAQDVLEARLLKEVEAWDAEADRSREAFGVRAQAELDRLREDAAKEVQT